jgi:hypothetical protein
MCVMNQSILSQSPAEIEQKSEEFAKLLDHKLYALQQKYKLVAIGDLLGVKKSQAGNYINSGSLPARKLSSLVLALTDSDIPAFLAGLKGQVLVSLPTAQGATGSVVKESGEYLAALGKSLEDGQLDADELRALELEVADLYGAVKVARSRLEMEKER